MSGNRWNITCVVQLTLMYPFYFMYHLDENIFLLLCYLRVKIVEYKLVFMVHKRFTKTWLIYWKVLKKKRFLYTFGIKRDTNTYSGVICTYIFNDDVCLVLFATCGNICGRIGTYIFVILNIDRKKCYFQWKHIYGVKNSTDEFLKENE